MPERAARARAAAPRPVQQADDHVASDELIILAGTGNPALAAAIAGELSVPLAASGVERFPDGELSVRLGVPLAVLHKRRISAAQTKATHLMGDVRGRTCLLVDDIIATGGTLRESI